MKKSTLEKQNSNIFKLFVISLIVFSMIFAFPNYSKADDEEESDDSDLTTSEALEQAQENAEEARSEKQEMLELYEVKKASLDEIDAEVESLQETIDEKQGEIDYMNERIAKMRYNIGQQKGGLGNRLRNMYKSGSVGFFDVLLDSKNFSDFLSNLSLVQRIYDSDRDTLGELEEQHQLLQGILDEMEVVKGELDGEMTVLENKQLEAEAAKAEVEAILDEIQARIDEYEAEEERLSAQLAEEQAELMRQLASASATDEIYIHFSGASDSGFVWPCYGPLTSFFGYRDDVPIGSTNHGGIDIGCSYYAPIYAARSGYVSASTGWSGGYGYAVYLIHDSGYSTVYGHNSEILVSPGEYVSQGQIIAYAGSTGWSTGPHCHFEVRVNGVQTDPLYYLP